MSFIIDIMHWVWNNLVILVSICVITPIMYCVWNMPFIGKVWDFFADCVERIVRNKTITEQEQQLKAAAEQIRNLQIQLARSEEAVKQYSSRLAEEMSKKVSANESNVENVSIKNRPVNIAEEYEYFCANGWLSAKEELDRRAENVDESTKVDLLFKIIMKAEDEVKQFHKVFLDTLANPLLLLNNMASTGALRNNEHAHLKNSTAMLPVQVTNAIGDYLRHQADDIDLQPLVQKIRKQLEKDCDQDFNEYECSLWKESNDTKDIKNYLSYVTRIAWKMIIQRPPMKFSVSEHYDGEEYQDIHWGSVDPRTQPTPVICYVYPMLYHSGSLMARGKILLVPQRDHQVEVYTKTTTSE